MKWPTSSIRATILLGSILPAIFLAVVLSFIFLHGRFVEMDSEFDNRGQALANQLAAASEFAAFAHNNMALSGLVGTFAREPDVTAVLISDSKGQTLARFDNELTNASVSQRSDEGNASTTISTGTITSAGSSITFTAPIMPRDFLGDDPYASLGLHNPQAHNPEPLGRVNIEMSLQRIQRERQSLIVTGIAAILVGLLGAVLLSVVLSRIIVRPLLRIKNAVDRIGQGEHSVRIPVGRRGDMQQLEQGLNRMADRLDTAQGNLRKEVSEATKQLELKKEEAERANLAKSRFLAAASHDLRQPLHALGLFAAALNERIKYPEVRLLVDSINRSVAALEGLFNTLLDICRLDAGVAQPTMRHLRILDWIPPLVAEFQPVVKEKGLRLYHHGPDIAVFTDRIFLETMLRNLIGNAVRYTDRGEIAVAWTQQNEHLLLEVRDTGIGIEAENLTRIFQEFLQLNNPERDRSKGLGLGLAIVERVARIVDCSISVESVPGQGSNFRLKLPIGDLSKVTDDDSQDAWVTANEPNLFVLVVDDELAIREAMQALLQTWGYRVHLAESAAAALASLPQAPDVIIADYRLREHHTGVEAIKQIQSAWGSVIPAMIVTGDLSQESIRDAQDSGFDLMHKPLQPGKLRAFLRVAGRSLKHKLD